MRRPIRHATPRHDTPRHTAPVADGSPAGGRVPADETCKPVAAHYANPAELEALRNNSLHICEVLHRVCIFNGTFSFYEKEAGEGEQARLIALSKKMIVRDPFDSMRKHKLAWYHPLRPQAKGTAGAKLLSQEVSTRGFSECLPLVWLPVWSLNFAEQMLNSAIPLYELRKKGIFPPNVLLRPDTDHFPFWKLPPAIFEMWGAFSENPVSLLLLCLTVFALLTACPSQGYLPPGCRCTSLGAQPQGAQSVKRGDFSTGRCPVTFGDDVLLRATSSYFSAAFATCTRCLLVTNVLTTTYCLLLTALC